MGRPAAYCHRHRARRIRLNLKTIPEVCAIEFLKPLKRRLEGKVLAQANRQIKASKVELDAPTAKGVLFLVNDGDTTFVPRDGGLRARPIAVD